MTEFKVWIPLVHGISDKKCSLPLALFPGADWSFREWIWIGIPSLVQWSKYFIAGQPSLVKLNKYAINGDTNISCFLMRKIGYRWPIYQCHFQFNFQENSFTKSLVVIALSSNNWSFLPKYLFAIMWVVNILVKTLFSFRDTFAVHLMLLILMQQK